MHMYFAVNCTPMQSNIRAGAGTSAMQSMDMSMLARRLGRLITACATVVMSTSVGICWS